MFAIILEQNMRVQFFEGRVEGNAALLSKQVLALEKRIRELGKRINDAELGSLNPG